VNPHHRAHPSHAALASHPLEGEGRYRTAWGGTGTSRSIDLARLDATAARLLAAPRQPGESHPFIAGTDAVQRYFTVMVECATASKLRAGAK